MPRVKVSSSGAGMVEKAIGDWLEYAVKHSPSLSAATSAVAKGGRSSVKKGEKGVKAVTDGIISRGGKVRGTEVTFKVQTPAGTSVRIRADGVAVLPKGTKLPDGTVLTKPRRIIVEVKNGPSARHTPNQTQAFPHTQTRGAVPVGPRAGRAGLPVGRKVRIPVYTVYL